MSSLYFHRIATRVKYFAAGGHVCLASSLLITTDEIIAFCLFWGEQLIGLPVMWYIWTPITSANLYIIKVKAVDIDSQTVYYSLSLTERISKGCHRSPVIADLINRTCHIPLHPLPFSELIKAIPICCNYTKHVTIKLSRWLIWVVERIN